MGKKDQSDLGSSAPEAALAPFRVERAASVPMYRQIYEALRNDILAGRLSPGRRLSATRTLATHLGVSRHTVVQAFDQLMSEGYLQGRVGAGTYVARSLPEHLLQVRQASAPERSTTREQPRISQRVRRACELVPTPIRTPWQPFQSGLVALDRFPIRLWKQTTAKVLSEQQEAERSYGDPGGDRQLRAAIADHLYNMRGLECDLDQVLIVGGSQAGLDLAARVLLDPGDTAWVEDPGYPGTRAALVAAGVELEPVPVDSDGIQVEYGKELVSRSRLACVTPSHQYPLGATMSLTRRLELLDWANQSDSWILEDDYDSEYRYVGRPISPLKRLDSSDRVIYLGTFSKVLFPALRLGYLVVPTPLIDAFLAMRYVTSRQAPVLEQSVLARFIQEGHLTRHLRRMRVLYQERQTMLRAAAARELAGLLELPAGETGLDLVGWLPEGTDDRVVAEAARDVGVLTAPLSQFRLAAPGRPGLLLGYAAFDEVKINDGMRRLATALESVL